MKPEAHKLIDPIMPVITDLVGKPVRAELYKLSSYSTGGFFGGRRDTPKSEDHIGTLVVCLPSKFTGGNLIYKHKNEEATLDWAEKLSSKPPGAGGALIQWVFSYVDSIEHSVEPVKSGFRLTLSYDIFAAKPWASSPLTSGISDSASSPFYHVLKQSLADPRFLPEGGTVAFSLIHEYPVLVTSSNHDFRNNFHNHLKGADAIFYSIAILLGLKVEMRTVYEINDYDEIKNTIDEILEDDYKAETRKKCKMFLFDEFSPLQDEFNGFFTSEVTTDFEGAECDTLDRQIIQGCQACLELPVIWAFKDGGYTLTGAYASFENS
jgi:hypothetical protein